MVRAWRWITRCRGAFLHPWLAAPRAPSRLIYERIYPVIDYVDTACKAWGRCTRWILVRGCSAARPSGGISAEASGVTTARSLVSVRRTRRF
jgi:hypothetical protein